MPDFARTFDSGWTDKGLDVLVEKGILLRRVILLLLVYASDLFY